ncbi:hypothetical protein JHK87_027149 [Glycine soja]|nr:hypothetical protein JHK87_027149 [Glycine soja]
MLDAAVIFLHNAFCMSEDLFLDDQENSQAIGFLSFLHRCRHRRHRSHHCLTYLGFTVSILSDSGGSSGMEVYDVSETRNHDANMAPNCLCLWKSLTDTYIQTRLIPYLLEGN